MVGCASKERLLERAVTPRADYEHVARLALRVRRLYNIVPRIALLDQWGELDAVPGRLRGGLFHDRLGCRIVLLVGRLCDSNLAALLYLYRDDASHRRSRRRGYLQGRSQCPLRVRRPVKGHEYPLDRSAWHGQGRPPPPKIPAHLVPGLPRAQPGPAAHTSSVSPRACPGRPPRATLGPKSEPLDAILPHLVQELAPVLRYWPATFVSQASNLVFATQRVSIWQNTPRGAGAVAPIAEPARTQMPPSRADPRRLRGRGLET